MYLVGKLIGHQNLVVMYSKNCRYNNCRPLEVVQDNIGLLGRGCRNSRLHCYTDLGDNICSLWIFLHSDMCQRDILCKTLARPN